MNRGRVTGTAIASEQALATSSQTIGAAVSSALKQAQHEAGPNGHIYWDTFEVRVTRAGIGNDPDLYAVTVTADANIDDGDPLVALALAVGGHRPSRPIRPETETLR